MAEPSPQSYFAVKVAAPGGGNEGVNSYSILTDTGAHILGGAKNLLP